MILSRRAKSFAAVTNADRYVGFLIRSKMTRLSYSHEN
jgi:hypothetical protein